MPQPSPDPAVEALPLADLRVVELGQLLAGPFCGQLLGDFGAQVVKVEDPGRGDPMREWGREKPMHRSNLRDLGAKYAEVVDSAEVLARFAGRPETG